MKKLFNESIQIIRQNWKSYLWINILFYGVLVIGVIYSQINPSVQTSALSSVRYSFNYGFYSPIYDLYYIHRNVLLAVLLTFSINLFYGALLYISIPSLVIPFFGFLGSIYMAFRWGIIFGLGITSPLILCLSILEGQGYIIATFGVYHLAVRFLRPKKYNFSSHLEGYLAGLKMLTKLYILIISVLLISAFYEVGISTRNILFPNEPHTATQLGFSGANIKMKFSGSYIYYDSTSVNKSDAKVIGIMLEDILYFKPDVANAARLCKNDSCCEIQLYLDDKYWTDSKINKSFINLNKKLNLLYGKVYHVKAFFRNLDGIEKAKYF